jgi:hypothetical protein
MRLFESFRALARRTFVRVLLAVLLGALLWGGPAYAKDEPLTYYVQTIVGTNRDRETNEWKKVGPHLRRELSPVFHWKHYWQVDSQKVEMIPGKAARIRLTQERGLELVIHGDQQLELRLYRDGKIVRKLKDVVSHRHLIMGGDSNKDEAWFVVVRRDKPSTE